MLIGETLQRGKNISMLDELKIRKWLAVIKETDLDIIDELLGNCRTSPEHLEYCLELADEPVPVVIHTGSES